VKREKRLTKKERKALNPRSAAAPHQHQHIHCIACGRHLEHAEFSSTPATALMIACRHGTTFPTCAACVTESRARLAEHDRTGHSVQVADAWH
jgi:hypothetical protein